MHTPDQIKEARGAVFELCEQTKGMVTSKDLKPLGVVFQYSYTSLYVWVNDWRRSKGLHVRTVNRRFKCNKCLKPFKTADIRHKHEVLCGVTQGHPTQCPNCKKALKNKSGLASHLRACEKTPVHESSEIRIIQLGPGVELRINYLAILSAAMRQVKFVPK